MIDTILWLAPVGLIFATAYPTVRYLPWSDDWRPPSSRLTLLGLLATLFLMARHIVLGRVWGAVGTSISVLAMLYAYRMAVRAEAAYESDRRGGEQHDG